MSAHPSSAPAPARPLGTERPGPAPGGDVEGGALGRSSLINLVGFGIYGFCGFLLMVVVTRDLGPADAGSLFTAIAVFNIVARSAMAGTDIALVRFISRFLARGRHRELRTLFNLALGPVVLVSAAAGLAVFLLADPLGRLLTAEGSAEDLAGYLRILAPFIPVAAAYQVVEGGSRGFGTMLPSVVVERIGRAAALPVLMYAVLAAGGGVTAIALAWAGPFAVAMVPLALWSTTLLHRAERDLRDRLARREPIAADEDEAEAELAALTADRPGGASDHATPEEADGEGDGPAGVAPAPFPVPVLRRRFWSFALPRSLAGVFALVITWVDSLLLGALEGSEAVGVYAAATRWLIVGNIAGNAVVMAFGPQISSILVTEGAAGARRLFQQATAWFVLLAWPPYLAAIAFAPFLVRIFGEDFGAGADVIVITGFGFLLAAAAGPIDMLLLMAGRSRLSLINTGIALVVNVGANLVLIPLYGIRGAALAWTLSLMVANGLPLIQMWHVLGIQPLGARSIRALAIAGGVGACLAASRMALGATFSGLATGLVLGGAVLVAGIWFSPDRMGVADVFRRAR